MIVEMDIYKLEVKRVIHLKAMVILTPSYFVSYIFLRIVLLLLFDAIFDFKY